MHQFFIKITWKIHQKNFVFFHIQITSEKVHQNDIDFLLIEIMSKSLHRNDVDFFAHWNCVEKSRSNRRRFFAHQNYVEQSTSKWRWLLARKNYVEESTSKRRQFFVHQNYIKRVWQNDVEIIRYFLSNMSTQYCHRVDADSTCCVRWVLTTVQIVLSNILKSYKREIINVFINWCIHN